VKLQPVGAALRNYASPIFVRGNPMPIFAAFMVAATVVGAPKAAAVVAAGGIHALFRHRSSFLFFWWYIAFYVPACFTLHYWREVGSNLATAVPGLRTAELLAITIVLSTLTLLFATSLIWLGAPMAGALALAALAIAGGCAFSAGGPTGQSKGIARVRLVLFVPLILLGSQSQYFAYIVFAPAPMALALAGLAIALTVSGLRYYPARAASQIEANEHRVDLAATRIPRNRLVSSARHLIGSIMTWKPAFMPIRPLPMTLGVTLGPIGWAVALAIQIIVFLFYMPVFAAVLGHSFVKTLIQTAPQSLGFSAAITVFGSGLWLINRSEWPCLYMAGRYGGRNRFSRVMANAFRAKTVEFATIAAFLLTASASVLGIINAQNSIPAAICSFGLIFGASYAATLPLLWRELGGVGFIVAFALGGGFATMGILSFGIFNHGPKLWGILCTIPIVGLGLIMSRIAPRRLATMDWPIETESAP
jgi:hypothetical protein